MASVRLKCSVLLFACCTLGGLLENGEGANNGTQNRANPNPFQVRLIGGSNDVEGRVEVTHCGHNKDAGAICYSGAHPNPLQIRLIGGSNDDEGRVEVLHDGSWRTVCDDDDWDLGDARVVCRMMGYDGALDAPGSARFGEGSGRALLKYANCDGTENNLADCAHSEIGRYSCSHVEDAGAVCYSGATTTTTAVPKTAHSNTTLSEEPTDVMTGKQITTPASKTERNTTTETNSAEATTTTTAVPKTAHSSTTVSEEPTDVMTGKQITTPASKTERNETTGTNSAEGDSTGKLGTVVVTVVVVGVIIFLLFSIAVIVYKGWRMSSSSHLTPQPKTSNIPNPGNEGSTDGDRRDYADIIDSPRPTDSAFLGGGELGSTRHGNLTSGQASPAHGMGEYNEYSEIGEQDYNVLFGGKERGIYHQYTMIPDNGRGQRQKDGVQNTGTGQYQELLMDETGRADYEKKSSEGDAICGTRGHLLDVMEKGAKSKVKAGGSAATSDHVYQPLLKTAGNKSLDPDINLPTKSENECSDRAMVSAHKSLKDCGPEYATLEPDTTNLSLDPVSSSANGFLSLNKDTSDPDYAVLEPETSIHGGSDKPMDSTHQPLRDCGPEYATLEPDTMDTTNLSRDPVSSSASAFQSLNKDTSDPDYAVLEPETSINGGSDQSIDITE